MARVDVKNAQISRRRRGPALEEAILDAAWEELADAGYSKLTYEAVARRAATSRPVLYRRWPTVARLAIAAIMRYVTLHPITVQDLGNVRDELFLLLRRFADRAPPRLVRLIFEMQSDMQAEELNFADHNQEDPILPVLERAVSRGEVDPDRITPRILRLPTSLVLHETMISLKPIPDAAIREIIDQLFLPLIMPRTPG